MSEIFDLSTLTATTQHQSRVVPFPTAEPTTAASSKYKPSLHEVGNVSPLVKKLCDALHSQQISYCHWKSNWQLDRWLTGEGDLDLLVDRADAQRFATIIHALGFKQAEPPSDRAVPGILNFYGFDNELSRFVHLHVHYQLVIGHDVTKNYHLPIENSYLENSIRRGVISIPTAEFEFIVFVFRMVLKHSALELIARSVTGRKKARTAVEQELDELEAKIDRTRVANLLTQLAPAINPDFFDICVQSLRSEASAWTRMRTRQELERRLQSCARYPHVTDVLLKLARPIARLFRQHLLGESARKRFVNGGLLVAVVGGDGAGKTTALNEIHRWLGKKFLVGRFHIGKPRRSTFTYLLIVMLRIRRLVTGTATHPERQLNPDPNFFPGYLQLLRWVSAGRDRYRVYTRMRRFATNGGIALCDRYPIPQVRLMEGPNIARTVAPQRRNGFVKRLMRAEASYYRRMMSPDLLIVLRVDPDIAVIRKPTETERHVRTRSMELWEQDWTGTNAHVIDASQSVEEVVRDVQSVIWSKL